MSDGNIMNTSRQTLAVIAKVGSMKDKYSNRHQQSSLLEKIGTAHATGNRNRK